MLPLPSRTGAEGPPRPFGVAPPLGPQPAPTAPGDARAQNRALLYGPFPGGGLARAVSDGRVLLDPEAAGRSLALERIAQAGATVVRIPVDWSQLVDARPAAGFQAADPASPDYHFGSLDAGVISAAAAGLTPLLVVSHAPAFAEAPERWRYAYPGSWAPSPTALGQFAQALARRYDGDFSDPADPARALPEVHIFQAWNEPNLARYLEPQWVVEGDRWSPFAPLLYRQMLNAFYAGVKAVAPAATVVSAGVAPDGERAGEGRMAPLTFLRTLLCLSASGRAQRSGCGEPAHLDVLAFHPLSVGDPDVVAPSSLDVSIADAAKVSGLLARARAAGTVLPAGRKPLWVTELNWESAPQSPSGVPARLQAAWVSRALHRLWVAGVSLVAWQFLVDPWPALRASTPTGGAIEYQRPAGLYLPGPGGSLEGAQPKPFLQGFALPFDPLRASAARIRVWALLRAPRQAAVLELAGGGRRVLAHLHADAAGVLNVLVTLRGAQRLRLRAGGMVSADASVPALPAAL